MRVCTTIADVRAVRAALPDQLGFVPTMGALHAGHMELVRLARAENSAVAASIFVNPTQFSSTDDFQRYPRDVDSDLAMLRASGVDLVFVPTTNALYPYGFATTIDVGPIAQPFEGVSRPGHFNGVATVVTILFNLIRPARAYFGQKDAQQLLVIRRLVADLQLPVNIVAVPTVRDSDGLALSSRNELLTRQERLAASAIPQALRAAQDAWDAGERDTTVLLGHLSNELLREPTMTIEYLSLADPETLSELHGTIAGPALVLIAVTVGGVRLIDNCLLPASRPTDLTLR